MPICKHITLKNQLQELLTLEAELEQFFSANALSLELLGEIMLVTEELLVNTINYGYPDEAEHSINIEISLDKQQFSMELMDDARPFNPLLQSQAELGLPGAEIQIGGLGIPLVRALSDSQNYQYKAGKNHFIFTKRLPSQA